MESQYVMKEMSSAALFGWSAGLAQRLHVVM